MPTLRLTRPTSIKKSIQQAKTLDDEYGFRQQFRKDSVDELIAAFNREVGCTGWVAARGVYLTALRDALLATGLDCSSFISIGAMAIDRRVTRRGRKIVPVTSP
jgi:hypothetical protein